MVSGMSSQISAMKTKRRTLKFWLYAKSKFKRQVLPLLFGLLVVLPNMKYVSQHAWKESRLNNGKTCEWNYFRFVVEFFHPSNEPLVKIGVFWFLIVLFCINLQGYPLVKFASEGDYRPSLVARSCISLTVSNLLWSAFMMSIYDSATAQRCLVP